MEVDPWHYTGSSDWHKDSRGEALMQLTKERLSEIDIPVVIGGTGYPIIKEVINGYGWTIDPVGRMIILLDHTFIFQRMKEGSLLLSGSTKRGSSSIFTDYLQDQDYENYMNIIRSYNPKL